jgi:hypothetical protein
MKVIPTALLTASLAGNLYFLWVGDRDPQPPVQSYREQERVIVRTKGGLLEASTIHSPEIFEASKDHTLFGIVLGNTVTRIRVPAVYRYHVDLAPEWRILLRKNAFIVVAPSVKPALPVAVDLGRLQQEASGTWSVFTGTAQLKTLQSSITKELAKKASSRSYIEFQREAARLTVKEFVAKWLITQKDWNRYRDYPIHVYFADEPISALKTAPPPIVESE